MKYRVAVSPNSSSLSLKPSNLSRSLIDWLFHTIESIKRLEKPVLRELVCFNTKLQFFQLNLTANPQNFSSLSAFIKLLNKGSTT